MNERPLVYRTSNVEKLDHHRQRYEKATAREQTRLAMEHARAMHDLMIEIWQKLEALDTKVDSIMRNLNGGGG
jgi:hypothetical protein